MTKYACGRHTALGVAVLGAGLVLGASSARADGNLQNVNHIIIAMQENHSFDNYFGVLGYVANTPYHNATRRKGCDPSDNACVDGLRCRVKSQTGELVCRNRNKSNLEGRVKAFHATNYCPGPDLEHGWVGSHQEGNFKRLNNMLRSSPNNGFVRVNAETQEPEQITAHETMGYFDDTDLPFYYDIAKTFAISDRYFCSIIGPTFPNRAHFLAGTSFGHLTTSEAVTGGGYKPITGTIFDRMDAAGVTWTDYYSDFPYSVMFATSPGHIKPVAQFAVDAAADALPDVAFIDGSIAPDQMINGFIIQTDEHPPANIRGGQYFISQIVAALRNSPSWNDSVLFFTYDEHGGFYDHVKPPAAPQGGADTPDGIGPGLCADLSNPPASLEPGGGVTCSNSANVQAPGACPEFIPGAAFPEKCASFDQLGFRVPFVAISPFSKPHYVSHVVASHASFLAMIEKRFTLPPLTARDANASDLQDLFDFDTAPSLNAVVGSAPLPKEPPAFDPGDPGCPF